VQSILESARLNWRHRHLSHRPLLAQTLDA
jgi:hypothetical protein